MNTRKNAAPGTGFRLLPQNLIWLLLVWAAIGWPRANATTDGEMAVANSPLPHEKLAAGRDTVKVHWMRLQGYLDGTNGHAAMLKELKAAVQHCVESAQLVGRATRPPKVWPDYVESTQSDSYHAINRTITYGTTLLYTVNHTDCSLVESRRVVAKLASTKGICQIDFENKKAFGVCDANAHADAPPTLHILRRAPFQPGGIVGAHPPSQAALAAMEQARQQFGPIKTGERKTVAGVECDMMTHVLGTDSTACVSHGGSFTGWPASPGSVGSNLELEFTSLGGVNGRAVKAQLDATVNSAVFAPYLADGFQVTNIARRK